MNEIALRPSYWASVSGGKDSLYMLKLILDNRDKYPLDGVVHFELEIDYPFIKNVIDYMETECKKYGIPFLRISPRKSWKELYNKYGFPTRKARWCNDKYKLYCKKQLQEWLLSKGYYIVFYIGYCKDETKRMEKRKNTKHCIEHYPLVDYDIMEDEIWEWAKEQPIYNNYYKTNKRCGCMYCPMSSFLEYAYLYKYYPDNYEEMIKYMKDTEKLREKELGRPFSIRSSNKKYNSEYVDNIIKTKWVKRLEE